VKYVTSFVHPVAKDKLDLYRRTARKFGMPGDGKRMFWRGST
jgi:uncharacterized protein YbaA (DUF1428 family)